MSYMSEVVGNSLVFFFFLEFLEGAKQTKTCKHVIAY